MTTTLLDELVGLLGKEGVATAPFAGFTEKDNLIVVDMQNDFVPAEAADGGDGGRFAVAEGQHTIPTIVKLIEQAAAVKAPIYATRDYHPADHCSFNDHGGPFPPHCVQGSVGSKIVKDLATVLHPLAKTGAASIVFKAFTRDCDSFGGLPYDESDLGSRVSANKGNEYCKVCWTGSFVLKASNLQNDVNAPPDVMAVLNKTSLKDKMAPVAGGVVYVCGLAFDFCVLDTAVNAVKAGHKATIVINAARAANIPGFGKFGSGFLSDPKEVADKLKSHGINLVVA